MTNAYLNGYQSGCAINVTGGKTFRKIFATLISRHKDLGVEWAICVEKILRYPLANYITILPDRGFLEFDKPCYICRKDNKSDVRAFLQEEDAFALHRPVRKRFTRNPYAVNNVMDVWECALLGLKSLGK